MKFRLTKLRCLLKDNAGVAALEYGLIVLFIGLAALIAMKAVGQALNSKYVYLADCVDGQGSVNGGPC